MKKRKAGKLLGMVLGASFILSSAIQMIRPEFLVEMFEAWGLAQVIWVVAAAQFFSALLFVIPATRKIGNTMLSAYLGGAIVAHLGAAQYLMMAVPAFVMALIWLSSYWQHPEMFEVKFNR